MIFERLFGGAKSTRFECVSEECGSRCCRNNLVVLNEDDILRFEEAAISPDDSTERIEFNDFLKRIGAPTMPQFEGILVLILRKDEEGNCAFLNLDNGRCRIYASRPFFCREFPFKLAKNRIKVPDKDCIGLGRGEEMDIVALKEYLGIEDIEIKPPYLVGDEGKVALAGRLMGGVFKAMRRL